MTEARGPFGPRHRWGLWIVGRWPSLIHRFLEGAAPREPPFVGVSAGSGPSTRGPYATGLSAPFGGVSDGIHLCADRILRGSSGGNWMVTCVPPVRRRCRCDRALVRPFHILEQTFCPSGGVGTGDPGASCPGPRSLQDQGIWLILPVVICLSQRLSHACLSISTLYCETANGSLNQLSFI